LGGFVFHSDENAYELLKSYLLKLEQKFDATAEGLEIIEDIEGRIAELFLNKLADGREIIGLKDIEEVIAVMGEPDAYSEEEEGAPKARQRHRGKLYREPENAVVGGVASGIARHLGINSAWVRLGFLISVFAWTFGFWAYVILWMVLPRRSSPLYRPNEPHESGLVQMLNGVFSLLGRLVKGLFRMLTIVLGIVLVLAGLPFIIVILGISIFPSFNWVMIDGWGMSARDIFSFLDFAMVHDGSVMSLILFLIVTIIPVLLLTYWGVRLLFLIKVKDAWLHITAGVLWFVSFILLGVVLSPNATLFVENESSYERVELSAAPDTLWLMMNTPIDLAFYDRSISVPDNEMTVYYNKEKKQSCGLVELDIHTSLDSLAYFRIKKEVTGASRTKARRNLDRVTYSYVHNAKHLALDEGYFTSSDDAPWIPSHVEIDLFVPASTVLLVDKRIKRLAHAEDSLWGRSNEIIYVDVN
ncbi:MAG: PspC domain-containing protein, partial [Bacteroidales bacterium]|nr:PspC domain-containing protein [Bacteroidales bacterium]